MNRDRLLTLAGVLLLAVGIAAYVYTAVTGSDATWLSFLCLMLALLFFNLPAALARRRARRRGEDQE